MKRSALELAIASRIGDAMATIAGDVARSHDLGALLTAARSGDRTVSTMVATMGRASRADDTLAHLYNTRASRVLPPAPAPAPAPAPE